MKDNKNVWVQIGVKPRPAPFCGLEKAIRERGLIMDRGSHLGECLCSGARLMLV